MEELKAVQNEALIDETIKHELERIKDFTPGSNEYKAAYECNPNDDVHFPNLLCIKIMDKTVVRVLKIKKNRRFLHGSLAP